MKLITIKVLTLKDEASSHYEDDTNLDKQKDVEKLGVPLQRFHLTRSIRKK